MSMLERARNLKKKEFKSWDAKEGSAIAGEIVTPLTMVEIKGAERYLARVLSEEDGEEVTIWCGTVLLDLFKKLNPQVGDEVAIRCFGIAEGKRHKDYAMEVERHTPLVPYAESKESDLPLDGAANGPDSTEDDIPF